VLFGIQLPVELPLIPVGASLLAKVVNDNARIQVERVGLELFASKLAPTGEGADD
jgi:hypothetical protein